MTGVGLSVSAEEELGRRIRVRRRERGWTQEDLAFRAAMEFSQLGRIERGRISVTLRTLLRIACALGVDPAELVGGLRRPAAGARDGPGNRLARIFPLL